MKSKKIIIFDMIGAHTGALYYDIAFYNQLKERGTEPEIHSNFCIDESKPFFKDIFNGSKIKKSCNLLKLICVFVVDVMKNKKNNYILLSYGAFTDLIFMRLLVKFHPNPIVDIHEFVSTDKEFDESLKSKFTKVIKRVPFVILHSHRTEKHLNEIGYSGTRLMVPHFKYCFNKSYDTNNIDNGIRYAIKKDKINCLFFGNMRQSKGIDTIVESIKIAPADILNKLNFVFAGIDSFGIVKGFEKEFKGKVSFQAFLHYMSDEEANFLYDCSDIILLPYKEVSQSGVLEMAVYFRKTMLLSDIPYFKEFALEYPSFAYLIRKDNSQDLVDFYNEIVQKGVKKFSSEDIVRFYQQDVYDKFFDEFKRLFVNEKIEQSNM